jgi:predicted NAD/FAD-dependent oxidoreductase
LQARGWRVLLLDKGRSPGGRMATRRIGESRFDHGAQFFTVRDPAFGEAVGEWQSSGWVAPWFSEGGHARYWSCGGMNALAKHLAAPLDVRTECKVERVEPEAGGWEVTVEGGERFRADSLVLTPPAPQSLALVPSDWLPPEITSALRAIEFDPCFALLVSLDGAGRVPAPGYLRPENGPVEWIADNTQKGVSTGTAALTIHARAEFSREHLETSQEEVARLLLEAAAPAIAGSVTHWQLHRWKYAKPVAVNASRCLFSQQPAPVAIAGDAFGGPRVEGAFLSGLEAAERLTRFRAFCIPPHI